MFRGIVISSLLVLGCNAIVEMTPTPLSARPIAFEWVIDCSAGTDGFAANCTATQAGGDYTLKLQTADSQVFVSILHESCETGYRNFDRSDLVLLAPAERRALIERAFHEIAEEVRRTCPTLAPPVPAINPGMPDIAILSPDVDN